MGKLALGLNPLSKYFGENAVTPTENELCFDEATGDIHTWHYVDNRWQHYSRTAQIQAFLDQMESSGVFQSSAAFVQNRKIHRFYFDTENGVVRIDPDLVFDPIYRYYAIREIDVDEETGTYTYVTGVTGTTTSNGSVTAALVDMIVKDSESADGTQISVPGVGGLIKDCVDGNSYIVEFYDTNRQLLNFDTYAAVKVRTAETDLCPDTAVTDMAVTANQFDGENFFLYQGQDVDALELETRLKYGDNLWKDVSHEEVNGGRLVIQGLDEIDTSTITSAGSEGQEIDIVYQMVRSNSSFKSESAYTTDNGAVISPASLTIKMTKKVVIKQNPNINLETVIPVPYINPEVNANSGVTENIVRIKYFAYYSNGTVQDITSLVTYSAAGDSGVGSTDTSVSGATKTVVVSYPKGTPGQTGTLSFSYVVDASNGTIKINGKTNLAFVKYDPTQTSGNQYSGKFTAIAQGASYDSCSNVGLDTAIAFDGANLGNSPNIRAVRYRDVKDSTYYYTDTYTSPAAPAYYKLTGDHVIYRGKPILVEYLETTTDNNSNIIASKVVGAVVHYALPEGSN